MASRHLSAGMVTGDWAVKLPRRVFVLFANGGARSGTAGLVTSRFAFARAQVGSWFYTTTWLRSPPNSKPITEVGGIEKLTHHGMRASDPYKILH